MCIGTNSAKKRSSTAQLSAHLLHLHLGNKGCVVRLSQVLFLAVAEAASKVSSLRSLANRGMGTIAGVQGKLVGA